MYFRKWLWKEHLLFFSWARFSFTIMEWDEGWTLNAAFGAPVFFISVLGDRDLVPGMEEQNRDVRVAEFKYKIPEISDVRVSLCLRSDSGSNSDSLETQSIKASKKPSILWFVYTQLLLRRRAYLQVKDTAHVVQPVDKSMCEPEKRICMEKKKKRTVRKCCCLCGKKSRGGRERKKKSMHLSANPN